MSAYYRTALSFARLSDTELDAFTQNVIVKMTGNPSYPNPKISLGELQGAHQAFVSAMAAAADGGKIAVAVKNAAREKIIGLLRAQAAYVQSEQGNDLAALLSSGFEAAKNDRTRIPLEKPVIERIDNSFSRRLNLRIQPVPTARAYEVRISYGTNGWEAVGVFTQARQIVVENLTPGTVYTVQSRAVGGSTGYSDWSDPVSHMAT